MISRLKSIFNFNTLILQFAVILLAIPALLINLGLFPLISDEPTRGIVTLEMMVSNNYIHPTINGEHYFNKPPLFNWIQALLVKITGSMDEWVFRIPTVISIIGLCVLIYSFSRKYLKEYAIAAALTFVVAGRVLFWDSFMGLIDITYSLVTFGSFAWMIHYHSKGKYLQFFIGSYVLAAIGFMLKGIPSVAFQGLSILCLLLYDKRIKQLFSWQHALGILAFAGIVGSYYLTYSREFPLSQAIVTLFEQSNRLKSNDSFLTGWFLHLFEFPVNMFYEFAPVSILALLLLSKEVRHRTFEQPYFKYVILLFGVNIIIYWLSADMRSRYLFMLVPLLSIVLIKAYAVSELLNNKIYRIVKWILFYGTLLVAVSLMIYPIWNETREMAYVWPISIALMCIALGLWIASYCNQRLILISLFGALLIARIGFNLFNLPARMNSYPDESYRSGEIEAARLSLGHPLYILNDTPFNHDASFYITRERFGILKRIQVLAEPDAFYLANQKNLHIFAENSTKYRVVYSFKIKLDETRLFLITKQ